MAQAGSLNARSAKEQSALVFSERITSDPNFTSLGYLND